MTIEELINELKQFPPHYTVEIFKDGGESDDLTGEIEGISLQQCTKIVWIEIGPLLRN